MGFNGIQAMEVEENCHSVALNLLIEKYNRPLPVCFLGKGQQHRFPLSKGF